MFKNHNTGKMAKLHVVLLSVLLQAYWSAYMVKSENTSVNLKIGLAGINPFVYHENNEFHGSDIQMIKILSKKLGFSYNLTLETHDPYNNVFHKVKSFLIPIK